MSLRTELTCGTCGGSGTYEILCSGFPPEPCLDCVEGIPRTLIEEVAEAIGERLKLAALPGRGELLAAAEAVLVVLRDREEPYAWE